MAEEDKDTIAYRKDMARFPYKKKVCQTRTEYRDPNSRLNQHPQYNYQQ